MLEEIALGSILLVVTTVVHAGCTLLALRLMHVRSHLKSWEEHGSERFKILLVAVLVLLLFYATLLEVAIWAGAFLAIGAIQGFEPAFYFSLVTYTTLGYGDIVFEESWRVLSSFAAANGIIMFGWTTALVIAFIQNLFAIARKSR